MLLRKIMYLILNIKCYNICVIWRYQYITKKFYYIYIYNAKKQTFLLATPSFTFNCDQQVGNKTYPTVTLLNSEYFPYWGIKVLSPGTNWFKGRYPSKNLPLCLHPDTQQPAEILESNNPLPTIIHKTFKLSAKKNVNYLLE